MATAPLQADEDAWPFWRKKTPLTQQIMRERKIVVSVKKRADQTYRVVGAGAVNVPLNQSFAGILKFEDLEKVSDHFETVKHDPGKKHLYMKIQGYGYVARMLLAYKITKDDEFLKQLDWKVLSGSFKGMVGHYKLRPLTKKQTEISLWSHFKQPPFPLPDFFLTFTLEVIAEKVAQKMRTYLESDYRKQQKSGTQSR